jgi:PKD repeat protein
VPIPGFSSSSPDIIGTTTVFTNTSIGEPPLSFGWYFGDGSPISTEVNATHVYGQIGLYTVWLTATNAGGSAAVSGTVEITGTAPVASFLHSAPVPFGTGMVFTNTTTPGQPPQTSYAWDFGDGVGSSTAENPVYTYTKAGTYTVRLTVTNLAGSSDFNEQITVEWVFLPLILKP